MAYNGAVRRGAPPGVHELAELIVTKAVVGDLDTNVYVLRCRATGDELVIDAGADADAVLAMCGDGSVVRVVTTHRHRDHWLALAEVVAATGARTVAHEADVEGIPVPTTEAVRDGDVVRVGTVALQVVHLPGHTPGSIALHYDDPRGAPHLFTGDSLCQGGPGATSPETFPLLMDGLSRKVFGRLPDETWVYPGHGADTTVGDERPHQSRWAADQPGYTRTGGC